MRNERNSFVLHSLIRILIQRETYVRQLSQRVDDGVVLLVTELITTNILFERNKIIRELHVSYTYNAAWRQFREQPENRFNQFVRSDISIKQY